MKVEREAVLTCSNCRLEGRHELLYLSMRLRASRCASCGFTRSFSGHLYADYARDFAERVAHLPGKAAGEMLRRPFGVIGWPLKAIGQPLRVLNEVGEVTYFERDRHRPPAPRGRRSHERTVSAKQ